MRISTAQFYEASSANYTRTYANVIKTGEEVASQIKLNSAADDPVGAARVLQLAQQNAMLTQYKSNISTIDTSVTQSETALDSIKIALQRVSELIVSAGNATYTDKDRQAGADELKGLQSQIFSLMNSTDANGQYLFSGSKSSTPPYAQNADGTFSYKGDQSLIKLAIGDGLSIASNTTGWDAFETAVNTARTSSTLTSPAVDDGKISLSSGIVTSASKYGDEYISGQPYKLTFLSSTQYKITDANDVDVTADAGSAGAFSSANAATQVVDFRGVQISLNVNLTAAERATTAASDAAVAGHTYALTTTPDQISTTRSPGNASTAVITNAAVGTSEQDLQDYNNTFPAGGAIIKFTSDTEYDLYASPLTSSSTKVSSGSIGTPATSSSGIAFTVSGTPAVGDTFLVNGGTQQTQNVLNTLTSVITAMTTPADGNPLARQKLQGALDSALGNISSGTERVSNAISEGGARHATSVSQGVTNDLLQGNNTVEQGKIVDSNPVDAIGRLTMQQTMLTASQLVFTRVSQLNLFSKL
jgi:flagellar hook-associated protein 3 FlgL